MLFTISLVFLFIMKIRFPTSTPINRIIATRYSAEVLHTFRKYEQIITKQTKATLDLKFLHACVAYNVFPKFLKFKLYKASLENTNEYRKFQQKLLENEIKQKKQLCDKLTNDANNIQ